MKISKRFLEKYFFIIFLFSILSMFRIREYGSSEVDFQILLKLGCFFLVLIVTLRDTLKSVETNFLFPIVLGFFCMLSALYSISPLRTFVLSIMLILTALYFFYLSTRRIELYSLFCEGLLLFVIVGFFIYLFIPDLGRHIYWYDDSLIVSSRFTGLTPTSNAMGEICAFAAILAFRNIKELKTNYIYFVVLSFLLLITWSKTAIILYLLCMWVLLSKYSYIKISARLYFYLFGVALIPILFLYGIDNLLINFSRHGDLDEIITFTGRTYIWPVVMSLIEERPFLGYGFGVTSSFISSFDDLIGYSPAHAHNLILQSMLSLGFVGTLVVCANLALILFCSYKINEPMLIVIFLFLTIRGLTESSFMTGNVNFSWLLLCFAHWIILTKSRYQ